MQNINISFEQIVAQLVTVFKSADDLADYQSENVQHLFCGWTGASLSPISRPAYVQEFGEDVVTAAEKAARNKIAEENAAYEKGDYFAATVAADKLRECGGVPSVGGYVWAVDAGFKCVNGAPGVFYDFANYKDSFLFPLCQVLRVEHVAETFWSDPCAADALVLSVGADAFPGGSMEYETPQGARYIINVCLCVSPSGKYCFIDSEGCGYARYIFLSENYKTLFSAEIAAEEEKKAAKDAAKAEEEAQAAAARKADYLARCAMWSGIMEPVAKYEAAVEMAKWGTPEYKKARRKLQSVRRSNILRMFKKACPGVTVSIRKNDGWGKDWYLTYQDGPSLEALEKITDFTLFQDSHDAHHAYEDYWSSEKMEFTEFADKYMGSWGGNGIKISREMSEGKKAEILATVCEVVPGVADRALTEGGQEVEKYSFSRADLDALCAKFGLKLDQICGNINNYYDRVDWNNGASLWVSAMVRDIFEFLSFLESQNEKQGGFSLLSTSDVVEIEACAPEGLELVDIPEGVAVVGDSRTTYRHRKEIKAKGCAWNREAKRWEATTPEAVATVKTWFCVADPVQIQPTDQTAEIEAVEPTGEEVETVQTVAAAVTPVGKTEIIPHYSETGKVGDFQLVVNKWIAKK